MKELLFILVLLYASAIDIRKRIVPHHVLLLLAGIGCIHFTFESILGGSLLFLIFFLSALLKEGIGGGDVKLAGMCGWVLGLDGLPAMIIGLVPACGYMIYRQKVQKKPPGIPLVPFLTFGCIITIILNL